MKVRHVKSATQKNFQYIVLESTITPTGARKDEEKVINSRDTNMRRTQFNLHHEMLVGNHWFIITEAEYIFHLKGSSSVPKTIIKRKGERIETIQKTEPSNVVPFSRIDQTKHFKDRLEERFSIRGLGMTDAFFRDLFGDHFIVQGAEFYNTGKDHDDPTSVYVCSIPLNAIVVIKFEAGKYVFKTAWKMKECKWFQNWFQDHMTQIETFPTIQQYFRS